KRLTHSSAHVLLLSLLLNLLIAERVESLSWCGHEDVSWNASATLKFVPKHPGAHLVSVHSSKHNDYLLCIVKKFNPNNLRIWVGGFELLTLVNFFWIDGSIWVYENWIGRWNDESCFVKKNYICAFKQ
uniref:C-type lectin domain-containing protein n=1 Tax=Sinocyclocheilus anshuiensis TaxID=1608454 RepID=A0A671P0X9_9TELE